jgi:hypothetical protein
VLVSLASVGCAGLVDGVGVPAAVGAPPVGPVSPTAGVGVGVGVLTAGSSALAIDAVANNADTRALASVAPMTLNRVPGTPRTGALVVERRRVAGVAIISCPAGS